MDITGAMILGGAVFYLVWEAVSLYSAADGIRTISDCVVSACRAHLWIPVLIGTVLGHWFWQYCPPCQ